jgi:hypothetical protein
MFTNISALSENGGQPSVGNSEFAATKPESAFDLPAIVTYTIFPYPIASAEKK